MHGDFCSPLQLHRVGFSPYFTTTTPSLSGPVGQTLTLWERVWANSYTNFILEIHVVEEVGSYVIKFKRTHYLYFERG